MRAFKYSKVVISCCAKRLSRHSIFYSVLTALYCCSATLHMGCQRMLSIGTSPQLHRFPCEVIPVSGHLQTTPMVLV